jgi:ABC-type nitrate/sulfonate/bicarbonate transport system permease component
MSAPLVVDPTDLAAAVAPRPSVAASSRPVVKILRRLLSWAISLAVVLGAWQLFLVVFNVNSFIGRGPLDVWHYLTTGADAADARSRLWDNSVTTLLDAFIGLGAGTLAAIFFAILFNLRRSVEQSFMPIAMVLRSVPLVAMTPLIALVFGRGLMCVTIVAGIVTFFPTLVNMTLALRATPQASIDLGRAYGASRFTMLRKLQIPSSLPALFASLRVSAPLALVGAVLAEFLVTGTGLGYLIETSMTSSVYDQLWAGVALITLYSTVLYTAISGVEKMVLARFADLPT